MFNTLIIEPFTNLMLLAYTLLGHNTVLSIVALTVILRSLMIPLTNKQQKSQQKMQEMQPLFKEIQDKYKDNPERMQQELVKIGYNPLNMLGGCLLIPLQLPIWIGLYRSILYVIPSGPAGMVNLYHAHYASLFPNFADLIPIASQFLWFNLSQPDRLFVSFLPWGIPILPLVVIATSFLQQKLMTPPTSNDPNDQSAQMAKTMGVTMPLMMGFFALNFASGLSIYFVISNIIGTVQYAYLNRERLEWRATSIPFIKRPVFLPPAPPPARGKFKKPESTTSSKKQQRKSSAADDGDSPKEAKSQPQPKQKRSRRKKAQMQARSSRR